MAKDKTFEWRMQGMIYAYKMAKENGLKALEQDIKRRNVLKADIVYKDSQLQEFWDSLSRNIYTNMLTSVLWVLYDKYGFRKERLHKFKRFYDEAVQIAIDLDYMGEHYVTLTDYAVELNEKYHMGLDTEIVAYCEECNDKSNPKFQNSEYIDGVIHTLVAAGYVDAAQYLEGKKGGINE